MIKIDPRQLWPAVCALAIAMVLPVLVLPDSRASRVATLDLEETGFEERYIQFLDSARTRASIVARDVTTLTRGETVSDAPEWSVERLSNDGWLARSPDAGVVFFVPVHEVSDWIHPFVYSFVRERRKGLELPRVEWTTLYVDRLYQGLFLRVPLPFDRPDADRRELLAIESGRVTRIDTWFELPTSDLDLLAAVEINPPHVSLVWLSALRSETSTLLIRSRRPSELALMPLPVSVRKLFAATHGADPSFQEDARAVQWNESWRADLTETPLVGDRERSSFDSAFEEYRDRFLSALRIHGEFHGLAAELQASLPDRQHAGVELDLTLDGS